jgi:dethiobiotin synthetase
MEPRRSRLPATALDPARVKFAPMRALFVTGTDTDIGKTYCSAVLALALGADYWKPVQAGDADAGDRRTVERLTGGAVHTHPEAVVLRMPASPHAAAAAEGRVLDPSSWVLPVSERPLVIEGAGGWLVPLNETELYADWVEALGLPVVLVSGNRLGSINHTLLTVEALMNRRMDVLGILFNGEPAPSSESWILAHTGLADLGRVPKTGTPGPESVRAAAEALRPVLRETLLPHLA